MKSKAILIIIIAVLLASCSAFTVKRTGDTDYFYESGNLIASWKYNEDGSSVKEGDPVTGKFLRLSPDNRLEAEYMYSENRLDGITRIYCSNGNIKEIISYSDGEKNGSYVSFYCHNGEIAEKGSYIKGLKDSVWEKYYDTGVREEAVAYRDGKRDGFYRSFHENGTKRIEGLYVSGKKASEWRYYDEKGGLVEKGMFRDNLRSGMWRQYDGSGVITGKKEYREGVLK